MRWNLWPLAGGPQLAAEPDVRTSVLAMLLSMAASGFSTSRSNATAGGRADYPTDGTNSLAARLSSCAGDCDTSAMLS